ncbi:MAG: FHA domain-containing protein [Alphaproteobacteria bacterium]|nr:FHA domain-containing protein [Alphaproteobacteria bacterium]
MSATIAGIALPARAHDPYPYPGATTAILFLLDVSDPRRERAVRASVEAVRAMMRQLRPHMRAGLGVFDAAPRFLAEIGSDPAEIERHLSQVRAVGRITNLYESLLGGVVKLAQVPARRHALIVLSDGQAEDKAYGVQDVIAKARAADVAIVGLGYADTPALQRELQSLVRLAVETGGEFVAAEVPGFAIPSTFLEMPYRTIERGGRVSVDIAPVLLRGLAGPQVVDVAFESARGTITAAMQVTLPRPDWQQWALLHWDAWAAAYLRRENLPWISGAAAGACFLLAFMIIALFRRRARRKLANRPFAELEFLDTEPRRELVKKAKLNIGRDPSNDVHIANETVSGFHAALVRRRDGGVIIADLKSRNGTRVNTKPVQELQLSDGDVVTLGEVHFRVHLMKAGTH